ncbi:hypothetical protein GGS23DRAFT_617835 [Durotheca rogersii]|uniref:uncharacterized protein n=1 Tax=Durotheca rogersii TaxID=419775 RepID=UPI00222116F7|nr:uncharacterized protein GGS23DRAFT_617835 [Durotheca rogersii]KAI5856182.1 hypothetical protein GGS23DRAFT_617835 [Durotheca rogersii]
MSETDMRLRLVVRRDGLPENRFLWHVPLENDPTISKLLEKVNETIPLEIGQRGLEDYAVELRDNDGTSFECLHFQSVRTILRPDDRVFIRALEKDDNRQRRLSGRHQISTDGRRLIDGIPFGRRLLRPPAGRPPLDVPTVKRPRLAYAQGYTNDGCDDDDNDPTTLFLTNGDLPADLSAASDAGGGNLEDSDFEAEEEDDDSDEHYESDSYDRRNSTSSNDEEEDLAAELRQLATDNTVSEEQEGTSQITSSRVDAPSNKISALQAAFPSAPIGICQKVLARSGNDLREAYGSLIDAFPPKLPQSALSIWQSSRNDAPDAKSPSAKTPSLALVGQINRDEQTHESRSGEDSEEPVSALVQQYDYRGLPPGSITSGEGLAQMAAISGAFTSKKTGESKGTSNTVDGDKTNLGITVGDDDDTSSSAVGSTLEDESSDESSEAESEGEPNEEASSHSSDDSGDDNNDNIDSDSDSSGGVEGDLPQGLTSSPSSSSESQTDDDSSDNSKDVPEEMTTQPKPKSAAKVGKQSTINHDENPIGRGMPTSKDDSENKKHTSVDTRLTLESQSNTEHTSACAVPTKPYVVPESSAKCTTQTQPLRNSPVGPLPMGPAPPGAGKESTKKRNARRKAAKAAKKLAQQNNALDASPAGPDSQSLTPASGVKALFEAKRRELLAAISNGGIEVDSPSQPTQCNDFSGASTSGKRKRARPNASDQLTRQACSPPHETHIKDDVQSAGPSSKRPCLDVSTGRRLLFGALGLRNPKTHDDEIELRAKLTAGIRPLQNQRSEEENNTVRGDQRNRGPADDSLDYIWKERIIYRAVECCHEGIELGEPPFPFVQRWDPQQQGSWFQKNKRGGQGKRAQRNQAHFYHGTNSGQKRKYEEFVSRDEQGYDATFNGFDDTVRDADVELNYDDEHQDSQQEGIEEQTNNASQDTDMDDLPSLPSNLSSLPILRPGKAQVGMVITWQQWSCSSATNWQPQLSDVTGVIVRIDDDATSLEVCIAKRDRRLDRNEKRYDQNTGQRIYDRFEGPDLDDDDDDGEDEGYRTISFAEIQQPRILQQPLSTLRGEELKDDVSRDGKARKGGQQLVPAEDERHTAAGVDSHTHADSAPARLVGEPTKEFGQDTATSHSSTGFGAYQSGQGGQAHDIMISDLSRISSPSRQLHESTSQAIGVSVRGVPDYNDLDPDPANSGYPSAGQSSGPLFGSNEDDVVAGTPQVVKPKFTAASSVSSPRSGRQPDYALDDGSVEPDSYKTTDDGACAGHDEPYNGEYEDAMSTPTPKSKFQVYPSIDHEEVEADIGSTLKGNPSVSGALSSLDVAWCTEPTSHSAQSQSGPLSPSLRITQNSEAQGDLEYSRSVRELDELPKNRESSLRISNSVEPTTQEDPLNIIIKTSPPSSQPIQTLGIDRTGKRKSPRRSSQFTLPPGTQVIELSSDVESVYAEDYADDEVDQTYSPRPGTPSRDGGWVPKKNMGDDPSNRLSSTAPIRSETKKERYLSSSQPIPTSNLRQVKPRKKSTSRF